MADFTFSQLEKKYDHFGQPVISIVVAGEELEENNKGIAFSDVRVELSAGFEASMASFVLYNVFDRISAQFVFKRFKKYVLLGSSVVIYFGYGSNVREVFRGFIAKVNFDYQEGSIPGVQVTCMDLKGIMMSNNSARQLKAKTYSAALKEILSEEPYVTMMSEGVFKDYKIIDTPDGQMSAAWGGGMAAAAAAAATSAATSAAQSAAESAAGAAMSAVPGASEAAGAASELSNMGNQAQGLANQAQGAAAAAGALSGAAGVGGMTNMSSDFYTVEMVGESDYEFFVRAAKRYNFDFFILSGVLYFRAAKSDTTPYMTLAPDTGIRSLSVEYDITGLYGKVEVRNVDPGKGKTISASKKFKNKISQGSKAKGIVSNLTKVYIDPTVNSKDDASCRADYLVENMSYRFGTLDAELVGLPELVPGKFIEIDNLGKDVENTFYLQEVIHMFRTDGSYVTRIIGKAAMIKDSMFGALGDAMGEIQDAKDAVSDAANDVQNVMVDVGGII